MIVSRPAGGTAENLGVAQRIGSYDPQEMLLVPYWAVLMARGLAGVIGNQAERGHRIDLDEPHWIHLLSGAILAAEPLPDVAATDSQQDLAQLLRQLADTLAAALPHP